MLTLLVYLSPLLILIVVFGLVVIVALCQANPEDVPAVLTEATKVFRRLADRVPRRSHAIPLASDTDDKDEEVRS
ncbi:hypothetical protein [Kutzneria buriramensis]|uniref:Uncharacterized protein n=1 Tax=Kutzneria buriramensis TaxID=1045776 RepID=A0A3E0GVM5_9PSEU|nr:hypothetical protein [Kutzneria buriramensis]REH30710.1 hypothetical protein BCF44_12368 [Kutzneria buriramensis]